jgi:hypothetical protein
MKVDMALAVLSFGLAAWFFSMGHLSTWNTVSGVVWTANGLVRLVTVGRRLAWRRKIASGKP